MPELLHSAVHGLPAPRVGKVREVYDLEPSTGLAELLIVATDRVSAFDATMANGIPDKGALLTGMSSWWMRYLLDEVQHHVIATDDAAISARTPRLQPELFGRTTVARKAKPLPVECVARGAMMGSLYKEYRAIARDGGELHGHVFPAGLREGEMLPEPIFTPATKAVEGHDENIGFAEVVDLVGFEVAETVRDRTLNLYRRAAAHAAANGLILADTKFEFGIVDGGTDGGVILIDEALTPDSSRYWDASLYAPGGSPPSFDKQFVRDFLEGSGWDKVPPGPVLPPEVVAGTRDRYAEAYRRIVGAEFGV